MLALLPIAFLLLNHFLCVAHAEIPPGLFETEPSFVPEIFKIKRITKDRSLLAPGYYFTDPLIRDWGYGPQLYTEDGELVWYGNHTAHWRVQDFHTCDFQGMRGYLCWQETFSRKGHFPVGRKVVYDNTFRQVGHNYTTALKGTTPDRHEFNMLPGGESYLGVVYQPKPMDLRPYAGPKNGWAFDGCMIEIETRTDKKLFQWCFLDHYPVWQTKVFIQGPWQKNVSSYKVGPGTYDQPWDFFHINAADKRDGDYLISSRFLDAIFKVAGPNNTHGATPGTVIWRLGGNGGFDNDFTVDGFNFSRQHAVRYVSENATGTTFSILANHWDGDTTPTSECSEGQLIRVNNETMTAHLLQRYPHPTKKWTRAQGGMAVLPNGNALLGWGIRSELTEFSPTGEVLFHADVGRNSYRAYKAPWVGHPYWNPKLLAYSKRCSPRSVIHAYVSWNGATEVRRWRFQASASEHGPWIPAGTYDKKGFETHIELLTEKQASSKLLAPFPRYVSVDALDDSGATIGSVTSETFVPSRPVLNNCNFEHCQTPHAFGYPRSASRAHSCGNPWMPGAVASLLVVFAIELLDVIYTRRFRWANNSYDNDRK